MIRGLAPQPRLLWAIAIGAGLIALSVASPVLVAGLSRVVRVVAGGFHTLALKNDG